MFNKQDLELINSVFHETELLPEKTQVTLSSVVKDVELLVQQLEQVISAEPFNKNSALNTLQMIATKLENIRIESRK